MLGFLKSFSFFRRIKSKSNKKTLVVGNNKTGVGHSVLPASVKTRYMYKRTLGVGAFGTVCLVKDLRLDRLVAMKTLNKVAEKAQGKFLFLEEAKAIASIDHDNIVVVYDVEVSEESTYITMEYLSDGSLEDRLKQKGSYLEEEAVSIIKDVIQGLIAVHNRDLIHGDIKPANILFGPKGRAKLVDFGISPLFTKKNGKILGTPAYMAPEFIFRDKKEVDIRVDVFGVGLVFFEMLTGERYYTHKNFFENEQEMRRYYQLRVEQCCTKVSDLLKNILKKLLEVEREKRYKNLNEVLEDLPQYLNEKLDFLPRHYSDNEQLLREVMEVLLIDGKVSIAQERELHKRSETLGVSKQRTEEIKAEVLKIKQNG